MKFGRFLKKVFVDFFWGKAFSLILAVLVVLVLNIV